MCDRKPLTDIKLMPLSLATALASSVLPHPGGPASRIPWLLVSPNAANFSGYLGVGNVNCSNDRVGNNNMVSLVSVFSHFTQTIRKIN